jgi:hypothetical protein
MFWSRAHALGTGVAAAVALLGPGLSAAAFGAPDGHFKGARGPRDVNQEAAPQSPGPQLRAAPASSQQVNQGRQPEERGRGRRLGAVPLSPAPNVARANSDSSRTTGPRIWQRPSPVNVQGQPNRFSRDPVAEPSGWSRRSDNRPTPYQLYDDSRGATTPQRADRVVRTQPMNRDRSRDTERVEVRDRQRTTGDYANPYLRTNPAPDRSRLRNDSPEVNRERPRETLRDRDRENSDRPDKAEPQMPRGGERRFEVPRADFRGPEADRNVKIVPPAQQERMRNELRERLLGQNRRAFRPNEGRPARDTVGNPVPADVAILIRDNVSRISIGYGRLRRHYGEPAHRYFILPRSPADYWDGYWDGYADGYWAGRHHRHHAPVVVTFYYGYYWSDPYWLAFGYPGYYPSVYHYWGWCPGWVYPSRVYYVPTDYVYVPATPYRYYYSGTYVDYLGAERAVEDTRRAWFDSEITLLAAHLTDQLDIRVYFDGEYSYSTAVEDYYAMTVDTMATTHTVALDFDEPVWISTHEFIVTGQHVFYDPSGVQQTIYVSYRFRRLSGQWYIVAVGSSLGPIQHSYRDFRYN